MSMVFSIMIYFTFTSIQFNKQVIQLTQASLKVDTSFKAAAIIIAVFSAVFIWYSNSFFTKLRKKEVALYCMLGVKKRQVARMLFYENLAMGSVALIVGILIGALFSKLFVMILLRIMSFNVTVIFQFSLEALLNTFVVFIILFVITSLHSYSLIYRFQLIELFKSEKTGQKPPKVFIPFALLALILIGSGYYLALTFNYKNLITILIILIITVIGTYFLFSTLLIFLIKAFKRNKRTYYKNLNIVNTSQLLHRIKSHSRTLATIAVLSATTITAMGTAACLYYDQVSNISKYSPFSYTYYNKNADKALDNKIQTIIAKHPKNKIINTCSLNLLVLQSRYPNFNKLLSSNLKNPYEVTKIGVISESEYRNLCKYLNSPESFALKSGEAFLFMNFYSKDFFESPLNKKVFFKTNGNDVSIKIKGFTDNLIFNRVHLSSLYSPDTLVVKDALFSILSKGNTVYPLTNVNIKVPTESGELSNELKKLTSISCYYYTYFDIITRYGMTIFLAAFIGLVFLICTGSIIFFKQLSEANEDKSSYRILKKLGVSSSEIKASLSKQIALVFGFPLLVGILHSLAALSMLRPILTTNIFLPEIITILLYTLIYLVYYFATVVSYNKIINTDL